MCSLDRRGEGGSSAVMEGMAKMVFTTSASRRKSAFIKGGEDMHILGAHAFLKPSSAQSSSQKTGLYMDYADALV